MNIFLRISVTAISLGLMVVAIGAFIEGIVLKGPPGLITDAGLGIVLIGAIGGVMCFIVNMWCEH